MRTRPEIAALVAGIVMASGGLWARAARAQPNLPPPPPPPIGQAPELPSLPPPPPPASRSQGPSPRRPTPPPVAPDRAPERTRRTDDVVNIEPPETHPVAVTLNPIGLLRGRLSANVEMLLEPHHSLVASPNALVFNSDRGGPDNLVSEGLGFASSTSRSFGIEFGYHYWLNWSRSLRGPFLGPALLLGSTTAANVGDATHAQSYWGLAFDVGWQEVLPGGFTAGAGVGLELAHMSGSAVVPRLLAQVGWSF